MKVTTGKPNYHRGILAGFVVLVIVLLIGFTETNQSIHYSISLITLLLGFGLGYSYRGTEKK